METQLQLMETQLQAHHVHVALSLQPCTADGVHAVECMQLPAASQVKGQATRQITYPLTIYYM